MNHNRKARGTLDAVPLAAPAGRHVYSTQPRMGKSSVGATWKRNMPPRWGLNFSFSATINMSLLRRSPVGRHEDQFSDIPAHLVIKSTQSRDRHVTLHYFPKGPSNSKIPLFKHTVSRMKN